MSHRIVVDTNLWISFLIGGQVSKLDVLFDQSKVTLLFSPELIVEFAEVASRPKFSRYFTADDLGELLHVFEVVGEFVEVQSVVSVCRDPMDNFLLALAIDGNADFLITGDRDLLELKIFDAVSIVSVNEFLSAITD